MKNIEQIIRYTSICQFNDDDWAMVLAYCREHFKGGLVHRALKPKYSSTYDQFTEWVDNGVGSGDIVAYGHTTGIVGISVPDKVILAAFRDFDGNLIANELEVFPNKVIRLNGEPEREFMKLLFNNKLDFHVKTGKLIELYRPKNKSYVTFIYNEKQSVNVGFYLKSEENKYCFSALLMDDELKIDCKIDIQCTPLRMASEKEIAMLHKKASKEGWAMRGKDGIFFKKALRNIGDKYWYMTERFTITADLDNGGKRHDERFEAGNYFTDETEALLFAKEISDKRKEGR